MKKLNKTGYRFSNADGHVCFEDFIYHSFYFSNGVWIYRCELSVGDVNDYDPTSLFK